MRGAIIFLVAFAIFFVVTIGYQELPPAGMIYDAVVGAETDYQILGISATVLIISAFNGIIYGIIIWLIYTILDKAGIIPKRQSKPAATTT
ncbi:MAG: hypothetical protein NWF11_01130 [Candidatus Bathyarchaeota archaeon]|nr:hypothetical protein [Candidatus Bathyarchaeota archaeon]